MVCTSILTGKSLVAVVGDMFAAGAGASSETINWAILYLSTRSDVQGKLQSEIDSVIGKNRLPSLSDRNR
jgi:cytochrome P450